MPGETPASLVSWLIATDEVQDLQRRDRFECMPEPTGSWMVWDEARERPAELAGVPLVGLAENEARSLCRLFNLARAA